MSRDIKQTVIELLLGIWIWTIVLLILVLLALRCLQGWEMRHTRVLLGFIAGGALGSFMAMHMAHSIEKAVELEEGETLALIRRTYLLRTVIVLVCAVLLYYTGWVNIPALFVALLGLKAAAYSQPMLNRILNRKKKKHDFDADL